jgi:hypothetical protein
VGKIVLLAVRARVAMAVVVVTAAAPVVTLAVVAAIVAAAVAAVMAVAVIVATAVVAATVVVAPPVTAVVIRSVSTQARVRRSPAAVARQMAIKPTATAMPGRRRDMTRAAARTTTHGVLTETATARVTDTAGRAR